MKHTGATERLLGTSARVLPVGLVVCLVGACSANVDPEPPQVTEQGTTAIQSGCSPILCPVLVHEEAPKGTPCEEEFAQIIYDANIPVGFAHGCLGYVGEWYVGQMGTQATSKTYTVDGCPTVNAGTSISDVCSAFGPDAVPDVSCHSVSDCGDGSNFDFDPCPGCIFHE
jgi:hypothetical protein